MSEPLRERVALCEKSGMLKLKTEDMGDCYEHGTLVIGWNCVVFYRDAYNDNAIRVGFYTEVDTDRTPPTLYEVMLYILDRSSEYYTYNRNWALWAHNTQVARKPVSREIDVFNLYYAVCEQEEWLDELLELFGEEDTLKFWMSLERYAAD